ncbi:phosphate transport system substrate-binding protein [Endobacter medicaginis]|uniref:Phosphate-binding protein PstS n=1 Tax=Endobacter medicaginis TaxID=1181271 RepID=A0A839URY1_9PROT|nr:phosphate ABC transporter substrate-binding protein PstS [Endobacter medicaginis]MBB3172536.1 phosphate transport system substrate-binding protein [Endobacter medicaginis]MCX5473976.1 phosphate ABC transporter substrate-binding protein PstS [Endobacter medicaginis]NVN29460.1 phosphate ABC transporter substrate-binding protein PstS [Endobacter medicaginis]
MRVPFVSKLALLCAAAMPFMAGTAARAGEITGAGSSFAAPIYGAWAAAEKAAGGNVTLNYQSIGSGAGQNQIIARTVDFGASDAPMAASKLEANGLLQFPTVTGAVVAIVNVPGIGTDQLKLSGDVLADIFAGKITNWNDTRIASANPDLKLPDLAIAPVHRADGSGTTFVFTSYLAKVSPSWKSEVGAASSISWPGGAGARGNDGVAATVHNTVGGIGYVEYAYAANNHLTTTQLKDHAGSFVEPTMAAFQAAAKGADWDHAENFAVDLLDTAGQGAWPIMSATFVLLPTAPKDTARSADVIRFFNWAYTHGNDTALKLNYVPLPASVETKVRAAWTHVAGAPKL